MPTSEDDITQALADERATIYDPPVERLLYDIATLEARLSAGLKAKQWAMPIRTRSKVAKVEVCRILGYPIPSSFRKTQPRFPHQNLDIFVQKSSNLQIWNEEVDPARRYALIRLDVDDRVVGVRVLTGEAIALLDRTGTLTTKYQAARRPDFAGSKLVVSIDTQAFHAALSPADTVPVKTLGKLSPTARPLPGAVLSIGEVYRRLQGLVGTSFTDPGIVNERGRGIVLQRLTCQSLGIGAYADAGQFPDILSQALEVKLQLSPTIDLGLVTPDSQHLAQDVGFGVRHFDTRYAVFYGERFGLNSVRVTAVVVTTGEAFFKEFRRFEGKVQNAKLQIPLPPHVFEFERDPDEGV